MEQQLKQSDFNDNNIIWKDVYSSPEEWGKQSFGIIDQEKVSKIMFKNFGSEWDMTYEEFYDQIDTKTDYNIYKINDKYYFADNEIFIKCENPFDSDDGTVVLLWDRFERIDLLDEDNEIQESKNLKEDKMSNFDETLKGKYIRLLNNADFDICLELIEQGANPNWQDKHGWTALIKACIYGYLDIIVELLKHGANIDMQDERGDTALDIARRSGHNDIVEVLEEYEKHEILKESKNLKEDKMDMNMKTKDFIKAFNKFSKEPIAEKEVREIVSPWLTAIWDLQKNGEKVIEKMMAYPSKHSQLFGRYRQILELFAQLSLKEQEIKKIKDELNPVVKQALNEQVNKVKMPNGETVDATQTTRVIEFSNLMVELNNKLEKMDVKISLSKEYDRADKKDYEALYSYVLSLVKDNLELTQKIQDKNEELAKLALENSTHVKGAFRTSGNVPVDIKSYLKDKDINYDEFADIIEKDKNKKLDEAFNISSITNFIKNLVQKFVHVFFQIDKHMEKGLQSLKNAIDSFDDFDINEYVTSQEHSSGRIK